LISTRQRNRKGHPEIDIEVVSSDGVSIAAEIKTTVPYQESGFGAQQAASFKKDFMKLAASNANEKFMLVTDAFTFEALKRDKYRNQITGVTVVNLISWGEFAA